MINRVVLVGRIVRDPAQDLRRVSNETAVLNFTIAVDSRYSRNNAEKTADFINCVAFNRQAEVLSQYAHKGSMIGVEGRLQTRSYEPRETPGKKVTVVEVVCDSVQLLESKSTSQQRAVTPPTGGYPAQRTSPQQAKESYYPQVEEPYQDRSEPVGVDISEDDLPF